MADALTDLHSVFVEMLEKQDQTDVVFKLGKPDDSELFRAHKLILGAASPIFKTMFSENWNTEGKPIEIKDVDTNLFKMFIKIIYTHRLPQEAIEHTVLISLYELSQMYQTSDAQDLVLKHILPICDLTNLISFANLAWLHNDTQLKKTCEKVFSKNAKEIFSKPDFFAVKTDVINAFYSLDAMNIKSEDSLVCTLDEYIMKNQEETPNIITKLKPAIDSIRLLIVKQTTIVACIDPAFKNFLSKGLIKLLSPLTYGPVPLIMNRPRRKVTVLSSLPSHMTAALCKNFSDTNICMNRSCNPQYSIVPKIVSNNSIFYGIYSQYSHTDLSKYSYEHIIKILDEFNRLASPNGGNRSEYKIFENYKMYLDP